MSSSLYNKSTFADLFALLHESEAIDLTIMHRNALYDALDEFNDENKFGLQLGIRESISASQVSSSSSSPGWMSARRGAPNAFAPDASIPVRLYFHLRGWAANHDMTRQQAVDVLKLLDHTIEPLAITLADAGSLATHWLVEQERIGTLIFADKEKSVGQPTQQPCEQCGALPRFQQIDPRRQKRSLAKIALEDNAQALLEKVAKKGIKQEKIDSKKNKDRVKRSKAVLDLTQLDTVEKDTAEKDGTVEIKTETAVEKLSSSGDATVVVVID
jgi:hypothetical protein